MNQPEQVTKYSSDCPEMDYLKRKPVGNNRLSFYLIKGQGGSDPLQESDGPVRL